MQIVRDCAISYNTSSAISTSSYNKINGSLVISSDCQWLVMSLHVVLWELLLELHTSFVLWCLFVDHEIVEEE